MSAGPIISFNDFFNIDYNNLQRSNTPLFNYFLSPIVPFSAVVAYLTLSKPLCYLVRELGKIEPKGPFLQFLTILHSGTLAVYSGWTAYYSINIVYDYINENGGGIQGLTAAICDAKGELWNQREFMFWTTHFYISKFYEFIDTFIILLKGRNPSFLQTFHHAGIVISMWGFVVSSASVVLVIVCFNSFIHFLMYTYYVLAALGIKVPFKSYLTTAQIVQFLLGMSITLPYQLVPGCLTTAQSIVLGVTQIYTIVLIILFISFYLSEYSEKSQKTKKSV